MLKSLGEDAQDLPNFPRRDRRCGLTLLATQPHPAFIGSSAKAGLLGVLPAAQSVRRRVQAGAYPVWRNQSAINGMLAGLDPHSSYMDPNRFGDIQVQARGEFGGVGLEVTLEDGLVKVIAPIDDTPAAKAGVTANDIISAFGLAIVTIRRSKAREISYGLNIPYSTFLLKRTNETTSVILCVYHGCKRFRSPVENK